MTTPAKTAAAAAKGAAAATASSKLPPLPLDLDISNCVVHNCQAEDLTMALELYWTNVITPNAAYGIENNLLNVEGDYDDVEYDAKDPKKSQVPDMTPLIYPSNLLVVPKTVSINTQPKKMLKMENKGWKKTEFETAADGGTKLVTALERRFRSVAVMGDYLIIGGLITYPGYDEVYDNISDGDALVKAAHENTTLNDIPADNKGIELPVTNGNFSNLAVVYINRGAGEDPESRFVVPQLCRVTVAHYLFLLQTRMKQSLVSGNEKKIKQYAYVIGKLITLIQDWLRTPTNSPDTVILIYNYRVVSDSSINDSEVFSFLDGTPTKAKIEDEKRLANWKYVLTKKNNTFLVITVKAKEREVNRVDEQGNALPDRSDAELLADDAVRTYTVTFTCRVPIIPQQRFTIWKKSKEYEAIEAEFAAVRDGSRKQKRGEKSRSKKAVTTGGDASHSKKAATDDDDDAGTGDDGGDDDEATEDDGDVSEGAGDDDENAAATKKKKKLANGTAQPTKDDIGKHGTAKETAEKVKKSIAAAKKSSAKKNTKEAQESGSADSSDDDGDDADDAVVEDKKTPRKKVNKKASAAAAAAAVTDESVPMATDGESAAARELAQIGNYAINIKKTGDAADATSTPAAATAAAPVTTTGKGKMSIKKSSKPPKINDDNDDDAAANAGAAGGGDDDNAKETAVAGDIAAASKSAGSISTSKDFLLTTKMVGDGASANLQRLLLRRRILKDLADMQSMSTQEAFEDDMKFPAYLAYESQYTNDEMELSAEVTQGIGEMLAGIEYIGLPSIFIDAQRRLEECDQAIQAESEAEEKKRKAAEEREAKRKAAEEAVLKRKAEEEEKKRKAAEEAARRKAEEEEKKRKAAEEAAAKKKAEQEAEAKRKAAEAAVVAAAAAAEAAKKQKVAATPAATPKQSATEAAAAATPVAGAKPVITVVRLPGETPYQAMLRDKKEKAAAAVKK